MADEIAVPPTARTPDCKLVTGLAELPGKTLLDERALAEIFSCLKTHGSAHGEQVRTAAAGDVGRQIGLDR